MRDILMVAIGGALGALGRHGVAEWAKARWGVAFPWGTLLVNAAGSLALGVLAGLVLSGRLPRWTLVALGVGFLGGFTTFSTFSLDVVLLLQDGKTAAALGNVAANASLGVAGAALGLWLASSAP